MNGEPAESGAVGQTVPLGVECVKCRYNLAGLGSKGVCPECGSAVAQSWPLVHLQVFLAKHAAPCPGCGRNLKGLEGMVCPSCGEALTLRSVLTRMSRPRARVWLFLLDLVLVLMSTWVVFTLPLELVRHPGPAAPWCVMLAVLPVLVVIRLVVRKRLPRVVPLVNPPALVDYLASTDAPCPGCGYNLKGLTVEACPECALPLSVPLLHAHAVEQAGIGVKDVAKAVFTTFVVCAGGIVAAALLIAAVGWVVADWSPWFLLEGVVVVAILAAAVRFLMRATKE